MQTKLRSRKFWIAIVGAVVLAVADQLGITPESATEIVAVIKWYLLGQGAVDAAGAYRAG